MSLRRVALAAAIVLSLAAFGVAARRAAAAATPATSGKAQAVTEVREFIERFNKAYGANDLKAYWPFYADDMTQIYRDGRLDMPDYKPYWEKWYADGNTMLEVRTADIVIKVSEAGDAAVAHYDIFTKQRHADGSIEETASRETDVLFKRGGRWQVVHLHDSPAPAKK